MKQQMSFPETLPSADAAPVWAALDGQHRTVVVANLARLIAKMAANRSESTVANEEKDDE